jgi:hypothetical protein
MTDKNPDQRAGDSYPELQPVHTGRAFREQLVQPPHLWVRKRRLRMENGLPASCSKFMQNYAERHAVPHHPFL